MTTSPTTDQPELLRCPFCGGEAELTGYGAPEFWVHCLAIDCKASTEAFGSKERAIAAWNRRFSFRESGTGDTVAFVQEWLMSGDHEPTQWDRDFAAAIDARATPTFTDAQIIVLAERFCATPLPDTVYADLVAIKPAAGRSGTNLLTVAEAAQMLRATLSAAPASPIPTSVANEGERERIGAGSRVKMRETGETGEVLRVSYVVQCDEDDGTQGGMGGTKWISHCSLDEIEALSPALDNTAVEGLRSALELARHVRKMVRAENAHARAGAADLKAGRHQGATSTRDEVDAIQAGLYQEWPAWRLDDLIAALTVQTEKA